jgi:hypothetical protein
MLLNFVMGMMFLVLPGFWITALTWAGFRAGNFLDGLNRATSDAKGAGSRGADFAIRNTRNGVNK